MSEIRGDLGQSRDGAGPTIHRPRRKNGTRRAGWQRVRGALAGILLAIFAFPTGGCLDGLMCSERCYGEISCARYSADDCGRHAGCELSAARTCGGQESCAVYDDASACRADSACYWEKNCC